MGISGGMRAFWGGIVATLVLIAVVGFCAVKFGLLPARADEKPGKLERTIAHMSLDATIAREMPQPPYPYASSDKAIVAGAQLYTQHCSMCHGNAATSDNTLSKGLYVKPPQLGKHGVDDDPEGETYWKIEHGIRFTAMPGYKDLLTEEQIWQITYFLKNTPNLPAAAKAEWNKPLAAE
jgi:mono/diheme cytochrome c family protein